LSHHSFIKLFGGYTVMGVSPRVHDRFLLLRRELRTKVFRIKKSDATFEPDIEEVRQIRVGYIVIVGRIADHSIETSVFQGE